MKQLQWNIHLNNRKKLEKAIERMEAEMLLGVFDYAKYFPKSARLAEIKAAENQINAVIF